MYKQQIAECRSDMAARSNDINDTILNGEIAVKVIRFPTGKGIGPGSYYRAAPASKPSHNLQGVKQFQDLKSTSKQKRDTSQVISSFYETEHSDITKILDNSKDISGSSQVLLKIGKCSLATPNKSMKGKSVFSSKSRVQSPITINVSEVCSQTVTTDNESKDLEEGDLTPASIVRKCKDPILIEYSKLAPRNQEDCRKNVVTPDFRENAQCC